MNIPFSPPFIDADIISEVVSSLESGWITTGPKVKALEEEICKLTGVSHALCVNSWTSGAILMLKWFGVKEGDEVIVPAYTYSATALAVLQCGGTPIMVDVKDDFTIAIEKIREKISSKTKVIIPVDIAGWPCDYNAINDLVNEPEIKEFFTPGHQNQNKLGRILVISDAAHSLGARIGGIEAGKLTDVTIFSLHAVKNITTAEGGVICLNLPDPFKNDKEYAYLRLMTLNGQTKDAFSKSKAGGWRYDIIDLGLKINMPDVLASIGLSQLRKYKDVLLKERKRVFQSYSDLFRQNSWVILPPQDTVSVQSSYHLYALRIMGFSENQRDQLITFLSKKGIAVNVHFIPMPMLTLFKSLGYKIEDYPNAYNLYANEISLPIYPQLSEEQIFYIYDNLVTGYELISEE